MVDVKKARVATENEDRRYRWRVRTRLPDRFGQACRVLVRGRMNTCVVEFEDGARYTTSRNYVRRIREDQ